MMDILYIRHKTGGVSPLLPNEVLLHSLERIRTVTLRCAHSYGAWHLPLASIRVLVTNRRLFLSGGMRPFYFYRQEVDLWFPGKQPEGKTESVTNVSVESARSRRWVEVRSQDPKRRQAFWSSPDLTVKLFCEEPEEVEQIICEAMMGNA